MYEEFALAKYMKNFMYRVLALAKYLLDCFMIFALKKDSALSECRARGIKEQEYFRREVPQPGGDRTF